MYSITSQVIQLRAHRLVLTVIVHIFHYKGFEDISLYLRQLKGLAVVTTLPKGEQSRDVVVKRKESVNVFTTVNLYQNS